MLAVLPLLAVALLCALVDGYAATILDSHHGNVMLALAALMIVAGLAGIQRLGRIEPQAKELES